MNKINVLQAFLTNDGGLSAYMLNNFRNINRCKFAFTFLCVENDFKEESEYKKIGANFIYIDKKQSYLNYLIDLANIFRKSNCDILHLNLSAANIPVMILAKLLFKGKVIIHSHSSSIVNKNILKRNSKLFIHNIGKLFIPFLADRYLACSEKAAKWMYPFSIINNKKYQVCKNAIDIDKFRFDNNKRKTLRRKFKIGDNTVTIGHVAAFTYPKNHDFVVSIAKSLKDTNCDFKLFFVGDGYEKQRIQNEVNKNNLDKNVIFLGQRSDVNDLMQMFDVLILPSRFEGLGFVAIEAQSSGLPCLLSDRVPKEVCITDLVHFMSLNENYNSWADAIMNYSRIKREDRTIEISKAGYNIHTEIKKIEKIYTCLIEKF